MCFKHGFVQGDLHTFVQNNPEEAEIDCDKKDLLPCDSGRASLQFLEVCVWREIVSKN